MRNCDSVLSPADHSRCLINNTCLTMLFCFRYLLAKCLSYDVFRMLHFDLLNQITYGNYQINWISLEK